MTSTMLTQPVTARTFLLGEGQDSMQALAHALNDQRLGSFLGDALQGLSQAGRAAVSEEAAAAVHGLLDLDLGGLVVAGWRKHADLRAAARRTAAAPGSAEVVELATHRVTSTHTPSVDLLVDGARVTTLHFELGVEFLVKALVGTVRDRRLVAFRVGSCDVTATLALEGSRLLTRREQLQLPLVIRLGEGIPLLGPVDRGSVPGGNISASGVR